MLIKLIWFLLLLLLFFWLVSKFEINLKSIIELVTSIRGKLSLDLSNIYIYAMYIYTIYVIYIIIYLISLVFFTSIFVVFNLVLVSFFALFKL